MNTLADRPRGETVSGAQRIHARPAFCILAIVALAFALSGCATKAVNLGYERYETPVQAAWHVQAGSDGVFLGLDVLQIADHPLAHGLALTWDAGSTAAVVAWLKGAYDDYKTHSAGSTVNAPPPTVSIQGNGNTVNYGRRK